MKKDCGTFVNLGQQNTALLVFSLSAEKEITRKSIFNKHQKKENAAFFNILIQQTKDLAYQSGIDVFWVDEHQQIGIDFSSRFVNAFQRLFDKGYENVVSIGNDCPDLTHQLLQDAIEKVQTKKLVLGPSRDGGIYLLGINRNIFDITKFQELPWQTARLQQSLEKYVQLEEEDCYLLDELNDLDFCKDVFNYVRLNPSTIISRFFEAIKLSIRIIIPVVNDFIRSLLSYSYVNFRAPPSV